MKSRALHITSMDQMVIMLPDWLPWWAAIAILAVLTLYLALFLLVPFQTFGLPARLVGLDARLDEIQGEIRALTLRLPERVGDGDPRRSQPPIPPVEPGSRPLDPRNRPAAAKDAPPSGFGDPVADRMLAYMKAKAQNELQRSTAASARGRIEPGLALPPAAGPARTVLALPSSMTADDLARQPHLSADAEMRPPVDPLLGTRRRFGRRYIRGDRPDGDPEPARARQPGALDRLGVNRDDPPT